MSSSLADLDHDVATDQPDQVSPTGYVQLIRQNANFRWLWYGQVVSLLGDWFNLIASIALVTKLTESGVAVGSDLGRQGLFPAQVVPHCSLIALMAIVHEKEKVDAIRVRRRAG